MRQTHVAGERLFVDYAGTTLDVIEGTTGEVLAAQLFVAALGASSYTWAEATWTQGLGDWIGSHTRAFVFFGGVAAMLVCDNLKSRWPCCWPLAGSSLNCAIVNSSQSPS
jgi:transposase